MSVSLSREKKGNLLSISTSGISVDEIQKVFESLEPGLRKKYLGSVVRKAVKPGLQSIKGHTPRGPTGNLFNSIDTVFRKYDRAVVGLAGYQVGGGAKGYHQGFLEFGTDERKTKRGFVASSYGAKSRGPFETRTIHGAFGENEFIQTPPYPFAFMKRASRRFVNLGKMPVGGHLGQPPVATAFRETKAQMESILISEMEPALKKAIDEQARRYQRAVK